MLGTLFASVLALGAFIGCGGTGEVEEATKGLVVRVSGTPGIVYMGAYGSIGEARRVDGILGFEPTDYEVSAEDDSVNLTAVFRKSQPGAKGTLRVEILADGEVVAEDETTAELGVARASWFPQGEPTVKHPGER